MTETERLRELLDERGVEWRRTPHYSSESIDNETVFRGEGIEWIANGHLNGHIGLRALRYEVTPEQAVEATLGARITGDTSDGYHTFNELYHHRAVLFSVIVRDHRELAWKSKLHHDGTMYDGMFIVGIETPNGQATYHYDVDPYWDMFDCRELERAPEWDGHTPSEAIERISTLGRGTCYLIRFRHNATDKLRAMLDERGIAWKDYGHPNHTWWGAWHAEERSRVNALFLKVEGVVSPEEAIAATLGVETCRNIAPTYLDFLCSECGFVHYHSDANDTGDGNEWRFCPSCGRTVSE